MRRLTRLCRQQPQETQAEYEATEPVTRYALDLTLGELPVASPFGASVAPAAGQNTNQVPPPPAIHAPLELTLSVEALVSAFHLSADTMDALVGSVAAHHMRAAAVELEQREDATEVAPRFFGGAHVPALAPVIAGHAMQTDDIPLPRTP